MTDRVGRIGEALVQRGLRLVAAESCTGGLAAARVTERAGASRFFEAGLVTYSNAAKERHLGVRPATLIEHGAVSEATAGEMLDGALRLGGAAIAITGIAGPGGGTDEKPVGTVWIGAAAAARREVQRYHFDGDRAAVREASVEAAFALLERVLGTGEGA